VNVVRPREEPMTRGNSCNGALDNTFFTLGEKLFSRFIDVVGFKSKTEDKKLLLFGLNFSSTGKFLIGPKVSHMNDVNTVGAGYEDE